MANLVQRPLNRLRKTDSIKPLHERWGDVAISAPTEGSWNQLEDPHHAFHRSDRGSHGSARDCSIRPSRESDDPISEPEDAVPRRQNSPFSMSTLNPRRLSMRLAPRSKYSADPQSETEHLHSIERRTEFAYKPIHQDYPTEVAEKAATRIHESPRFRYIPATGAPGSQRYSTSLQRNIPFNYAGIEDRDARSRRHHPDSRNEDKHDPNYPEPRDISRQSSRVAYRNSVEESGWAIASHINAASSVEKKRLRAAKRMTMTMVPDAEDIYG